MDERDNYEKYQNNYFRIYNENVTLKAQLKEANEQSEEIKKDKDELLDECTKKHYENYELKDNLEKCKENLETLRNENKRLLNELSECSKNSEEYLILQDEVRELRDNCERYQNELFRKSNENDELKVQLTEQAEELEKTSEKLEEDVATLRSENKKLKDERDKNSDDYLVACDENNELGVRLDRSEKKLTASRFENKKLKEELDKICNENNELKTQLKDIFEKYGHSEETLVTLNTENRKLQDERDKTRSENKKLQDERDKTCSENNELKGQLKETFKKYGQSEETLATLRSEIKKLKDERDKNSADYLAACNENDELNNQLKEISEKYKQTLATLFTETEKLKVEIDKNSKLREALRAENKDLIQHKANNEVMSNKLSRKDSEIREIYEEYTKIKDLNNLLQKEKQELVEKNTIPRTASQRQSVLGNVKNIQVYDDNQNNSVRLKDDILALQDMLKDYVTPLKGNFEVDFDAVKDLMKQHNINAKITSKKSTDPLIRSVLQYHILNNIIEGANKFFEKNKNSESVLHLEAEIASKSKELIERLAYFLDTRKGIDAVAQTASIKIRREISIILSNRGFSDILDGNNVSKEHYFIKSYKNILNEEMNKYRIIKDATKRQSIEEIAPNIIREFIRIIQFRLNVQVFAKKKTWVGIAKTDTETDDSDSDTD
jgi:chromosome segregation ATPase